MAKLTPEKRQRIEDLVYKTFDALDKTGANTAEQRRKFSAMSDAQFETWLKAMKNDEDKHFYLDIVPYKNEPTLEDIEAAAKITKTQLHQYVYFRHDGSQENPVRTSKRVPVGYLSVRRLQQLLMKKTSTSTEANKRNQLTGQLSGDDAVGRLADEESYALQTVGGENALNELLGPRADNRDKRLQMYKAIERDGYVRYADLQGDIKNQPTLNYLNVLLLGAGLKTDLIDKTELLRVTADKPVDMQRT